MDTLKKPVVLRVVFPIGIRFPPKKTRNYAVFNFYAGIEHVQFTSVKSWRNELSPFLVIHLLFNLNYLINLIYKFNSNKYGYR